MDLGFPGPGSASPRPIPRESGRRRPDWAAGGGWWIRRGRADRIGIAGGGRRTREEDGDDEDEEQEDDDGDEEEQEGRHAGRREPPAKSRRTEPSDLDVLALSVRAAAAARPDGGSRDRKNPSAPIPLELVWKS